MRSSFAMRALRSTTSKDTPDPETPASSPRSQRNIGNPRVVPALNARPRQETELRQENAGDPETSETGEDLTDGRRHGRLRIRARPDIWRFGGRISFLL